MNYHNCSGAMLPIVLACGCVLPAIGNAEPNAAADTAASPAPVATTTSAGGVLDEITVTAQKRSQSLNDVGLSITAATGQQLELMGIHDTGDLAKITPGLTFTKSQDGTPLYTIRGVGFNDYTLGASPAVSVYVDQVPLAYGVFTQGATLDLERVEVLKGPQGILFGQNSTGGAINYIANKPTQHFEAGVGVSYGRFDTAEIDGYISGPITDTLAMRFAIATANSGPWQQSVTRDDQLGRQDSLRARLQAEWKQTDAIDLLFSVNGWSDKSDTQAGQLEGLLLQVPSGTGTANPAVVNGRIAALEAYPRAGDNARSADWDVGRNLAHDDNFYQASLRADFKINDDMTLTSVSAYSQYKEDFGVDRDGTSLIDAGVNDRGTVESYSEELRLSGEINRLNWLFGGNYAANNVVSANDILTGDATNTAILLGGPFIAKSTTTITQDIRDYAVFGNAEFALTDKFSILGGARYTKDKDDYTSCMRGDLGMQATFSYLGGALSGVPTAPVGPTTCLNLSAATFAVIRTPFTDELAQHNVSWRGGVNFKPNEDILLYGLASRGYKSGSFPTVPASTTAQFAPVTQEAVTAYELGSKVTALDRKLQFNAAIFHYIYDNKQIRGIILDPVFNQLEVLVNVPKSKIDGAELEITIRPTMGLTLRAAATYVDSKVEEYTGINNARISGNFAGSPLPFSPKWHAVADSEYRWDLRDDMGAFVGGNLLYNSATNSTLGNPASSFIKAFTTLDLRVGVRSLNDRWAAWLWGRNVLNEYYWTNQFVTQDVITRYAAMPATFGASVNFNFR
jgi:iron complex outermembrane receptor protein